MLAEDRPLSHPITLRIEKCFSRSRKGDRGMLLARPGMAVPIQVSAERLPRALPICDALLAALEQAKYQLTWPRPYNVPLKVTVLEEPLAFLISEAVERKEHKPTSSEISRQKREPWWHPPRWDYQPTGRLKLTIEWSEHLGVRRSWSGGKKRRVEDFLGHFLVSLAAVAKALKRQREQRAEWERKWAEERKREAERAARRAEYERRAKAVESLARFWDQSKSFRAFAEKLSPEAERAGVPEEQRQDIRAMAEWVMRHAGFIDPFTDLTRMIRQFKDPPWSYGS
ncbi:MAG: hypothetical protein LAO04_06350 [Acidobacteriia bacterium]|nr:hypothetical protein [Terriglobia bacterium]